MRSATVFASILAFAAKALAQDATPGYAVISAPGNGEVVPSGKTYTIKWAAGDFSGPATISLMGGADPTTLQVLDPIASSVEVKAETFSWDVACSLGEFKTYGIKIADEATKGVTFQYSFPFEIKGPSCGGSDSSSSSTGYPVSTVTSASATTSSTKEPSATPSTTATGYPVHTPPSSSPSASLTTSSSISNSTTSVKTTTSASTPVTTLSTVTTPIVTVTESTPVATGSSSTSASASATTSTTPLPTAGAARTGAGIALGLFAAALAL